MRLHPFAVAHRTTTYRSGVLTLLAALACASVGPASATVEGPGRTVNPAIAAPESGRVASTFDNLPVSFEPNVGQAPAGVSYVVGGAGAAALTATGVVLQGSSKPVTLAFVGASPTARLTALDEQPGKANYLHGNDPSKWRTNVPTYAKVRSEQFYPGVDLVWYGRRQGLEYDLVVAPGADPGAVAFELDGAPSPRIDADGALVAGDVRLQRPLAYQEVGGALKPVASRYVLRASGRVAFELGDYDRALPLVIDPEIGYTYTFADASKDISIFGIAVDSTGAAYVAGRTRTEGAGGVLTVAAFVAKLNPEGTALVYSTTISGSSGSDEASDIAVDSAGNAYITGFAFSSNFPTTAGAFQTTKGSPNGIQDAFVAKLGLAGDSFSYSSFLGGSNGTSGSEIEIDASGNAYVTGFTQSSNFPTTTPSQGTFGGVRDAFLTKVNPGGSVKVYSTYLGGSQSDTGNGVAIDSSGNAYVVGVTTSTNFPITAGTIQSTNGGGSDAFWAKYDSAGQRVASSYLGGTGFDSANGIDVDTAGNSYLTGETASSEFPLVSPVQSTIAGDRDVFVSALNPTGTELVFSTLYGGSQYDYGTAVALDRDGLLYAMGTTRSSNFPTVDPIQPGYGGGFSDAFVIQLDLSQSGSVVERGAAHVPFASTIGGSGKDESPGGAFLDQGGLFLGLGNPADTGGTGNDESGILLLVFMDLLPPVDLSVFLVAGFSLEPDAIEIALYATAYNLSTCGNASAPGATFTIDVPPGFQVIEAKGETADVTPVLPLPEGTVGGKVTFRCTPGLPPESARRGYVNLRIGRDFPHAIYLVEATVTSLARECNPVDNVASKFFDPVSEGFASPNFIVIKGSKEVFGNGPQRTGVAPDVLLVNNPNAASTLYDGSASKLRDLLAFNVYVSSVPNVPPIPANLFVSVPPNQTSIDVSSAADGAFFVVTAVSSDGESPPSNEVGGTLPEVTKIKVSATKIVAEGTGFASGVRVFFAGLPFETAPKLKKANTKVIQKGRLATGQTLNEFFADFLSPGSSVFVLFVNGNGNAAAIEYTAP